MSDKSKRSLQFMDLLCIAFIVLKLCKVIDWSWLWVTAPLWGGILLSAIFAVWRCSKHGRRDGS